MLSDRQRSILSHRIPVCRSCGDSSNSFSSFRFATSIAPLNCRYWCLNEIFNVPLSLWSFDCPRCLFPMQRSRELPYLLKPSVYLFVVQIWQTLCHSYSRFIENLQVRISDYLLTYSTRNGSLCAVHRWTQCESSMINLQNTASLRIIVSFSEFQWFAHRV